MQLIKIFTNDPAIAALKSNVFKIAKELPVNYDEIIDTTRQYKHVLYVINPQLLKEADEVIGTLNGIVEDKIKTKKSRALNSREMTLISYSKCLFGNKMDINELSADLDTIVCIIGTIEKLVSQSDDVGIRTFIESLNKEVLLKEKLKKIGDIESYLKKTKDDRLASQDLKFVIIGNEAILQKNSKQELYLYIKEIYNYAEVESVELIASADECIEVYCFPNKIEYLNVCTTLDFGDRNDLRYIKIYNTWHDKADIYIFSKTDEVNTHMLADKSPAGLPMAISTNPGIQASAIDAMIPEEYITAYLKMLDVFSSRNLIITMADLALITEVTKGRLIYYKKKTLHNVTKDIEEFKQELKALELGGNAIFFIMEDDLKIQSFCLTVFENSCENLGVTWIAPRAIFGEGEKYIELFVFNT